MATYYIKTHGNRHIVVEADSFDFDVESGAYKFVREMEGKSGIISKHTVASVPRTGEILSIVDGDSLKSDSYYSEVGSSKKSSDVRLVVRIPKVEFRMLPDDTSAWGFVAENRFYPFKDIEGAKSGALDYINGNQDYESVPLDKTTIIPGVVQ